MTTRTGKAFRAWRERIGLTQVKAAEAIGVSERTVENYEKGKRSDTDRPVEVPKTVLLACSAVEHKLPPVG